MRSPGRGATNAPFMPMQKAVDAAHVSDRVPVGTVLLERGIIDLPMLERALAEQRLSGRRLGEILVDWGVVSWLALAEALAAQWPDVGSHAPGSDERHLLFGAGVEGWFLVERGGAAPAPGDSVDLDERGAFVVTKTACSPLRDGRRCAYLERVG